MRIECFKASVSYGEIVLLSMAWFSSSHLEGLQIFFINFSGLQQEVFPIFKLLNSTEADYDNPKSYD